MPEFQFIINEHNPHIIAVNEVLPKNHTRNINPEEFIIEGYKMVWHIQMYPTIRGGAQ